MICYSIRSSFLLLTITVLHRIAGYDSVSEEIDLQEQQRSSSLTSSSADGAKRSADDEPRYDLVLALIEKYLKEKSSRKQTYGNTQNPTNGIQRRGCNKTIELRGPDEGSINYPTSGTYLNGENCLWRIRVSDGKTIEIQIRRLSVEATEECRWDKLEIFEGSSSDDGDRSLVALCGFILPTQVYVTSGNTAVVRFTSDGNIGYGGFQVDYRAVERLRGVPAPLLATKAPAADIAQKGTLDNACTGVKELNESSGIIKFPLAGDYDNNLSCKWRIVASIGQVIQIQVSSIDIEEPANCHNCCWYDWLSLYDGRTENASSLMAKLCGTGASNLIYSTSSNVALVVFKSNARNGEEGFQLNYDAVKKDKAKKAGLNICAGQVTEIRDTSGVLQSPGFKEGRFPENARCRWRMVAPSRQVIRLRFDTLDIENDLACVYDSLSVYDGFNRSAPLIGRFCGNKNPPDITSSGSSLLISFESDSSMSDGGFSIIWSFIDKSASSRKETPGCDGEGSVLQQNEGVFTTPNYGSGSEYPNQASCSWRIVVEPGLRVFLRFEKFSLEPPLFDTECYDVASVYDGPNAESSLLGSYCGVYTPSDLLSSSNQLFISFKSDKSTRAEGFLARYAAKNITGNVFGAECGVSEVMPKVYSRIVGGVEATPHSWPWQVSIKYSGHGWGHWCGGSLLYPHWVITAAHCVFGYGPASNFRVVLGEHNLLVNELTEMELELRQMIIHEDYDSETNDNDIALFRLPMDVKFNRNMKPICLPREDIDANVLCITTGWGETKSTGNSTLLNQIYVPVISRIQCNQPTWYSGQLTDNMICAGYPEGRKDSCQGDSGGPLVCLTEGSWKLYGITSWGMDCALANHPGIYTRVTRYLGWIESKTRV